MKKKNRKKIIWITGFLWMTVLSGCNLTGKESLEKELSLREQGILKMEEGDYQEAVSIFQQALDQSLGEVRNLEVDICYYKALAQYKCQDVAGAIDTYTALIQLEEENSNAYYLRGTCYLMENQMENAYQDYQRAIALDPNNNRLFNKIGENLQGVGQNGVAEEILKQGLNAKGDSPQEYREKGYTYFLLKDYENARTFLDTAIANGDGEAVLYLARLLEAMGDTYQANLLYENFAGEGSMTGEILNSLGCARLEEGEYQQALEFFQKGLSQHSVRDRKILLKNEIIALEYLGEFAQAREKMKGYLTEFPDDQEAAREYEFLKSR